jgi:periplasmic protein TonB
VTSEPSIPADHFVADPEDRIVTPIDPWFRSAKRRFIPLVILVCLLHAGLLAFLLLRDHSKPAPAPTEVPVEVVVVPPPPPPAPKKKEQPKPKPQPKKEKQKRQLHVKPATSLPPMANNEKQKRPASDAKTQAPTKDKPLPNAQMKPTPEKQKAASKAAPKPAEKTAAPEVPDDKRDAEALNKATPIKAPKVTEKAKPTKTQEPVRTHDQSSLAREFAALSDSPHYSIAAPAKRAPIMGGHCNTQPYLCTLYALIIRQQHYPGSARRAGMRGTVIVGFWVDERGDLTHQALYRTSGYPELDREALDAIKRAAPFPPPPSGEPHGFVAQMTFPPK